MKMIDAPTLYHVNGNSKNGYHKPPTPKTLEPHNIEAEENVIGSLLIDPDAIAKISTLIKENDFYIQRLGWVYSVVKYLYEQNKPANIVLIGDELERRNQLKDIGGSAELTALMNATYTSVHVEYYAEIVKRCAGLRNLIRAGGEIARLAWSDQEELNQIMDKAEQIIFDVTSGSQTGVGPQPISSGLSKYYDRVEYLSQHTNKLIGLPTGLVDLDRLLGGLQRSDMVVLAGRPGSGKTSLALSIGRNAARKWGKRVLMFSLEMSDEQLIQRLVSSETGIDSQKLRRGTLADDEWPVFYQAMKNLSDAKLWIDDTPALSVLELRARARRIHAEHGLDLIIIDYLQLMNDSGGGKKENRAQEVSYISRNIKALARELNVPILALSQLSRAVEQRSDKRPLLSDLRESGSIEQDSDVVLFIYRDEMYNPDTEFPGIAEIIVSKHRSGPTGVFSVYFKKHTSEFLDLEVRTHLTAEMEPLDEPYPISNGIKRNGQDWTPSTDGNGRGVSVLEGEL